LASVAACDKAPSLPFKRDNPVDEVGRIEDGAFTIGDDVTAV